MVVTDPAARYTVPYGVFFKELADPTMVDELNPSLVKELYGPQHQCDAVFATLVKAFDLIPGDVARAHDVRTALIRLHAAVQPFMHEWEGRIMPDAYRLHDFRKWSEELEARERPMEAFFYAWRKSLTLEEFDTFSYNLATNIAQLIFSINEGQITYEGCARELNKRGHLLTNVPYLMADILEDFLNPYIWLLELVGDL